MVSVGVDVSKGKSTVCFMRPYGEVLITPYDVQHCEKDYMLKKNKNTVANMIGHFERDFNKKKEIFLGITLNDNPDFIVGVAEMFDYNSEVNMMTIGYRLNNHFWGKGIASKAVKAMTDYLYNDIGLNRIQAFVMPENTKSLSVLRRYNFVEEGVIRQGHIWKGKGVVDLTLFSMLRSEYTKCQTGRSD